AGWPSWRSPAPSRCSCARSTGRSTTKCWRASARSSDSPMLEKATIARPYARAAYEQASEEGKLREWSAMLGFIAAVVKDPLMQRVIPDPKLGEERLYGLVADICGDRLSETGRNFLRLLVDAGRLDVAPEIFRQFEE